MCFLGYTVYFHKQTTSHDTVLDDLCPQLQTGVSVGLQEISREHSLHSTLLPNPCLKQFTHHSVIVTTILLLAFFLVV